MITFQNEGVLDRRGLTTFGLSAKPESTNPIGYFGTGLKYAIAVLLRHGCEISIWEGTKELKVSSTIGTFRGVDYDHVVMGEEVLPFTTTLGKNWVLWMAYRELAANAMDEPDNIITSDQLRPKEGYTTIQVTGKDFAAVHEQRAEIFLMTKPSISLDGVDIHDYMQTSNWIYYRGIRVLKLPKQALYTYNITKEIKLTEDRTLTSMSDFYMILTRAVVACDHPSLIRLLLLANGHYYESQIDYNWYSNKPGETFNAIVERFISSGTSFNRTARRLYEKDNPPDSAPSIVQYELLPIEQRRKLWAARKFWAQLGIEISRDIVHVTADKGIEKGRSISGHVYITQDTLDRSMRHITGVLYTLYLRTMPSMENVARDDILLDTVVDFGERILGIQKKHAA